MTYVVSEASKIVLDTRHWAVISDLSLRQQQKLVEELKGSSRRLVNRGNNQKLYTVRQTTPYIVLQLPTLCFFASSFTKLITSQLAAESSPLVGSSRNSILGLVMSCAATLTLRFCPPETPLRIGVPMIVSAWSRKPNDESRPSMRALRSALLTEL